MTWWIKDGLGTHNNQYDISPIVMQTCYAAEYVRPGSRKQLDSLHFKPNYCEILVTWWIKDGLGTHNNKIEIYLFCPDSLRILN